MEVFMYDKMFPLLQAFSSKACEREDDIQFPIPLGDNFSIILGWAPEAKLFFLFFQSIFVLTTTMTKKARKINLSWKI